MLLSFPISNCLQRNETLHNIHKQNKLNKNSDYLQVLTSSSLIAFVSFLDCYSIGKTLAVRTNSVLEPDKELFALGVIGLVTSFFQCMPVTASFSRSSVNVENAKSQVSGLIGGLVVLMTMYFLTPLLFYLPKVS